ncbi:uncharacterized protein LOC116020380 [Ipomoea triloba]|uniref:uncharacterized protein LOC116020380 n=1 Tax=Ipomoea triloba TaxID=35885 RepID=UPI00125DE3E3|nr:uncharacterized protein LOC116020380 [Ipomoea triloba]
MNCLIWNCQGAASRSFSRTLKQFVRDYNPLILGLLEPRVSGSQADKICSKIGFDEWMRIEAVGFSGGIWVFWKEVIHLDIVITHPQFVLLKVHNSNSEPWFLSVIYGSPNGPLRKKLFEDLSQHRIGFEGPWLSVGDYNSVINRDETSNTNTFSFARCAGFQDWIFREGLVDLGYDGSKFTWMRGLNSSSFKGARLDRALGNIDWKNRFPNVEVIHLPMLNSDHTPLLIRLSGTPPNNCNKIFRFSAAWCTHPDYQRCVKQSWSDSKSLGENIKSTTTQLESWNKSTFGNIFQRKRRAIARIRGVQRSLAVHFRSDLIKLDRKLRAELENILYQEELLWFQRSREEWIVSGDRNTHFYHTATNIKHASTKIKGTATNIKHASTKIKGLRDNMGIWITDKKEILDLLRDYYMNLFSEDMVLLPDDPTKAAFPTLQETEWCMLNRPFTTEEVKEAVFDMAPFKAPGPDGFQAGFYQKTWNVVNEVTSNFALEFFSSGKIPVGCNDTVLSLIPKVTSPEFANQFRPIGLCNTSYKILTKMMTTRLKFIMRKLIGPYQTSFVPGRQITDNILVYQETLHSMRYKQGKEGWMIVKIDLEKAYDRLSWDFIQSTLLYAGFNECWIRNIMECVCTSRLAVACNGQTSDWFKPKRGIRQGDPISPILFVLCIERLSHLIENAVDKGTWKGLKITRKGPILSHLFFADDLVLFGEASMHQASVIKKCLEEFCSMSGQRNQSRIILRIDIKSTVEVSWVEKENVITSRTSGSHSIGPNNYSWIYHATTYLPQGVISRLERLSRDFIWGAVDGERKCNLINWQTVLQPKESGGLGIRSLEPTNRAYLAKLGWRFLNDEDSLWVKILKVKYTNGRTDLDSWEAKARMSNAWRGLIKAAPILKEGSRKYVKDGRATKFWLDNWIGHRPLCREILRDIPSTEMQATVSDYWNSETGWLWSKFSDCLPQETLDKLAAIVLCTGERNQDGWGWGIENSKKFSINAAYKIATATIQGSEDKAWKAIWSLTLDKLAAIVLCTGERNQDGWGWGIENSKKFSINAAYKIATATIQGSEDKAWKAIWSLKVPNRIRTFLWLAKHVPNRIRTFLWLAKHDRHMTNANRVRKGFTNDATCKYCGYYREDMEHIIRTCPIANRVWETLLPYDHEMMKNQDYRSWLNAGVQGFENKSHKHMTSITFAIATWWLWKWRNDFVFTDTIVEVPARTYWIREQVKEINTAFARSKQPGAALSMRAWKQIGWTKPPEDWYKMNIDGSCNLRNNSAGCGGLIRDSRGLWISGYMHKIGSCSARGAEAWALLKGIQLVQALGINKVIIETDSRDIWEGLCNGRQIENAVDNILLACKTEAANISEWKLECVGREQNRAADLLAWKAEELDKGVNILQSPPAELLEIMEDDKIGVSAWRQW